jgi:hypothetical protein
MECMQGRKQDYKRWRFGSRFRRRILVLSLSLRYLFSVGVSFGAFGVCSSLFSDFEIPYDQRFDLFSKHHIIFLTNMVPNHPTCDALQTVKRYELAFAHSKLSRLDWNATDPVHWSSRPCRLAWVRRTDLTYDSNSFARACLSLRTPTGKAFSCRGAY